ncbi:hypothetical protein Taro_027395 [Colocasia esculenta]|uniref:Uncharacterized protein n=1 Tax=Colocasia esculenta TaxID=4460 RepID=A0A843VHZ3_COLES|nr:hypothetical protein [Colocasia esculenta]
MTIKSAMLYILSLSIDNKVRYYTRCAIDILHVRPRMPLTHKWMGMTKSEVKHTLASCVT